MPDDDEIKTEKLPVSQVHKAVIWKMEYVAQAQMFKCFIYKW